MKKFINDVVLLLIGAIFTTVGTYVLTLFTDSSTTSFPFVKTSEYQTLYADYNELDAKYETQQEMLEKLKNTDSADYTDLKEKYNSLESNYNKLTNDYNNIKEENEALKTANGELPEVNEDALSLVDTKSIDKDSEVSVGETVTDVYGNTYHKTIVFPDSYQSITLLPSSQYDRLRLYVTPTKDTTSDHTCTIKLYFNNSNNANKEIGPINKDTRSTELVCDLNVSGVDSLRISSDNSYDGHIAVYGYFYNE